MVTVLFDVIIVVILRHQLSEEELPLAVLTVVVCPFHQQTPLVLMLWLYWGFCNQLLYWSRRDRLTTDGYDSTNIVACHSA
jgi:hypothetical protein